MSDAAACASEDACGGAKDFTCANMNGTGIADRLSAPRGASRRHAQIRLKDSVATITDLGSTNGTEVNGHPLQTATLDDGDRVTIGTTVLVFRRG